MKVIIDISEELYNECKMQQADLFNQEGLTQYDTSPLITSLKITIANSTPLKESESNIVNILNDIRKECWYNGLNMTDECRGVWVRYSKIDDIIAKHINNLESKGGFNYE